MQVGFEHGLQTAEDEVATRPGVDERGEVARNQVLREGLAIDAGEDRGGADEPVGVTVQQGQQGAAGSFGGQFGAAMRYGSAAEDLQPGLARVAGRGRKMAPGVEPARDANGVESKEERFGLGAVGVNAVGAVAAAEHHESGGTGRAPVARVPEDTS